MKRWSHLHGDMQEPQCSVRRKELRFTCSDSAVSSGKILSEIPCRVSSDPHEWRNELSAVSGRDSAKLQYL